MLLMIWTVEFTAKARKQGRKLPPDIRERFFTLVRALRIAGPVQRSMPHFGKLKNTASAYHCHLNKGRPTYVAVWRVVDNGIRLMEVNYVGTHENAPY